MKKMADKGSNVLGDTLRTILHNWKGIHVRKDAAVTVKMLLDNLASWFFLKLLT